MHRSLQGGFSCLVYAFELVRLEPVLWQNMLILTCPNFSMVWETFFAFYCVDFQVN